MPELPIKNNEFFASLRRSFINQLGQGEPESIVLDRVLTAHLSQYQVNYFGSGREAIVVAHESSPDKVVGVYFRDHQPDIKITLYSNRMLHALFPHNFPDIYMASSTDSRGPGYVAATVRQLIRNGEGNKSPNWTYAKRFVGPYWWYSAVSKVTGKEPIKYPFSKAREDCKLMGIPLNIHEADLHGANFMLGEDGGEYFLDTDPLFLHPAPLDVERIIHFLEDRAYSAEDKTMVTSSANRLNTLRKNYTW